MHHFCRVGVANLIRLATIMPIPKKYLADFEEHGIYHIYNRTNNQEPLFRINENRSFFLRKYDQYLSSYVDTYCWCLLPNHFHLLIKVKSVRAILFNLKRKDHKSLTMTEKKFMEQLVNTSEIIEHSFKRFFQSYALSFNKIYDRKGNLFYKPFKRVEIEDDSQMIQTAVYIHANPLKHKVMNDFTEYQWSSWNNILSEAPTTLLRKEIITYFGTRSHFIKTHREMSKAFRDNNVFIED